MSATQWRALGAGLFFALIFLSGFWLSNSGKPLNPILLTIHKLISVGAVVFLVVAVVQINHVAKLGTIEWVACAVTALFFVGAIASGGLLSTGNPMPVAILRIHQIAPFLTLLSTAATLYLLLSRK